MSCSKSFGQIAASILTSLVGLRSINGCDLCAIYGATSDRGTAAGPVFIVAEQYTSLHTLQYNSEEIHVPDSEFLDESITHLIPGYNFNRDIGVNLNVPIVHRNYRLFGIDTPPVSEGTVSGLGDISLIGRWTAYKTQTMDHSFLVNLLAGVKFPTGDTDFLSKDVAQERRFDEIFGPGHDHAFSGVHLHDLTLGSGSFDAVFGLTANGRYKRGFVTAEAQYYLRTEGTDGFRFGDTVMISGGPGAFLVLKKDFTLSLQGVARFEHEAQSSYSGRESNQTGMQAVYVGPQMTLSVGPHFSAQVGGDIPINVKNHGLQVVPDYRVHGSLTWSF